MNVNQASSSDISAFLARAKNLMTAGNMYLSPEKKICKHFLIMDLLLLMQKMKSLGWLSEIITRVQNKTLTQPSWVMCGNLRKA